MMRIARIVMTIAVITAPTAVFIADAPAVVVTSTGFAREVSRTRVPFQPTSIATGFGSVWVGGDLGVLRIDPTNGEIVAMVSVGGVASVTTSEQGVWISSYVEDRVARIDPFTNSPSWTTKVAGPVRLAVGEGAVWVLSSTEGIVTRLDPITGTVDATIAVQRHVPAFEAFGSEVSNAGFYPGLAVGARSVWVTLRLADRLVRIDPRTDRVVDRIWPGATEPFEVATGAGAVWVADFSEQILSRIDPPTMRVRIFPMPDYVQQLTIVGHALWATSFHYSTDGTGSAGLMRIDPRSGRVVRYLKIRPISKGGYFAITPAFGDLWVTTSHFEEAVDDVLYRVDPSHALDSPSIPPMTEPGPGVLPMTITEGLRMTSGHTCTEDPGLDCLQATDVYSPNLPGAHPVVVLAHEMCGDAGCKRYLANLADVLALNGVVVFNPDFGDPQGSRSKGGLRIDELACAVRFAREHAAEFGGDPNDLTLVSHLSASRRAGIVALAGDDRVSPNCLATSADATTDALVAIGDGPGATELPTLGENQGLRVRLLIGSEDARFRPNAALRVDGCLRALVAAGYDATLTVIPHAAFTAPNGHGAIDVGTRQAVVATILATAAA